MKDLEDLLPNQSLIPPTPPSEPGEYIFEKLIILCTYSMLYAELKCLHEKYSFNL